MIHIVFDRPAGGGGTDGVGVGVTVVEVGVGGGENPVIRYEYHKSIEVYNW